MEQVTREYIELRRLRALQHAEQKQREDAEDEEYRSKRIAFLVNEEVQFYQNGKEREEADIQNFLNQERLQICMNRRKVFSELRIHGKRNNVMVEEIACVSSTEVVDLTGLDD